MRDSTSDGRDGRISHKNKLGGPRSPRPSEPVNENPDPRRPQEVRSRRQRRARNVSRQKQSRRRRASVSVAHQQGEGASYLPSRASILFAALPELEKRQNSV